MSDPDADGGQTEAGNMNLGLEVAKGFAAKMIQAVLGFAGAVLFARLLGPTSFGGFYLLLSIVQIADRPIQGVGNATKKRFSEASGNRQEILGVQLILSLGIIAAAGVAALALGGPLESFTGIRGAGPLFVLLFAATALFAPLQGLLAARGLPSVEVWNDTLRSVFTTSFQLAFVLLGYGAAGMAYGLSLATFCCLPVTHYYLRTLPSSPGRETLRSVWRFARYSIASRVLGRTYSRLDILLLGYFVSQASVGYYEAAYKLTIPATYVTVVAGAGLMAKVSNLHSRERGVDADVTNTLAFSSLFAIPLFFGALAIPEAVVVTAYGPEYRQAAELLVGLSLYTVVLTQTSPINSVVDGLDMPNHNMRVSAAALALNVLIGVPLVLAIGAVGVVVGTVIAETFRYLLLSRVVSRHTGAGLLPRPVFEQAFAGVVMFVAVKAAHTVIKVGTWYDLALLLAVGGGVYFAVLTAISTLFRLTVRSVLRDAIEGAQARLA